MGTDHNVSVYEIAGAPSLRPPGTLVKRLRNINMNVYTQFRHVFRHPKVSTLKHEMKKGKN